MREKNGAESAKCKIIRIFANGNKSLARFRRTL